MPLFALVHFLHGSVYFFVWKSSSSLLLLLAAPPHLISSHTFRPMDSWQEESWLNRSKKRCISISAVFSLCPGLHPLLLPGTLSLSAEYSAGVRLAAGVGHPLGKLLQPRRFAPLGRCSLQQPSEPLSFPDSPSKGTFERQHHHCCTEIIFNISTFVARTRESTVGTLF